MEPRLVQDQYITAHGNLTLIGREPDGDSVRFIPNDSTTLLHLPGASRLRPASDGSLQLRIDSIDAPETHFLGQSQPLGVTARSAFLELLGFSNVMFSASGMVTASTPAQLPATIYVGLLDPYGRPVSYVIVGGNPDQQEGERLALDQALLDRTANVAMLRNGMAYVTLYSSTPAAQRPYLFAQAKAAHDAQLGVWAVDTTSKFTLTDHQSIGPDSKQLILPKLFRRATSYLAARSSGVTTDFGTWLAGTIQDVTHSQDDYVIRADGGVVRLHSLIQSDGNSITTELDLLSDVFIEQ